MRPAKPILLYGFRLSGHAHRVELMLRVLGLPYRTIAVDLAQRAQKAPDFLRLNPFGTVPVIDDDGAVVADSNAILVYLAIRYDPARSWLPTDAAAAAEVQRWLSIAQGPVYNGPGAARRATLYKVPLDIEAARGIAGDLFEVMDGWLAERPYLAGHAPTIADISNYSYISRAGDGGISLEPYPALRAWLARIEELPDFAPMPTP